MEEQIQPDEELSFWDQHRFLVLVGSTIAIAMVLVSISIAIYNSSGAAQLDLSRPGYRSVITNHAPIEDDFDTYPQSGLVDASTINGFQSIYAKQAANAKAIDAFGGDPLDPAMLGLSTPTPAP